MSVSGSWGGDCVWFLFLFSRQQYAAYDVYFQCNHECAYNEETVVACAKLHEGEDEDVRKDVEVNAVPRYAALLCGHGKQYSIARPCLELGTVRR